ncbi:MAG TPA: reverse transcriptase domain-containing protein, partial [Longimicrobiaceae bacterium]|nr:reverse transcriptase domain-containing protein [Longimicrobiaceae bacterium]
RIVRGVPQGTPTSPLLANFYLTPFDEHLEFEGVRAVRYVDDIAATARTGHEARNALAAMEAGLRPLGLELNRKADPVRSWEQKFEVLGFELRGSQVRVAPSKILEFRRHALAVLEEPRAGSMRRRIALLNRMVRGGAPTTGWEFRVSSSASWTPGWRSACARPRCACGRRSARTHATWSWPGWSRCPPPDAGSSSRPRPLRWKGTPTASPLEGADERADVAVAGPGDTLSLEGGVCRVTRPDGTAAPVAADLRAVILADGATCQAAALRHLLERGTALRFVTAVQPAGAAL